MKRLFIALIMSAVAFVSCSTNNNPASASKSGVSGSASIAIRLGSVGSLAKKTDISLTNLYIKLSAPEEITVLDTISLSGNGSTTVSKTYNNLASLKTWTLTVNTLDLKDSLIHSGSTIFDVQPRQTTNVSLDLSARFSMLKAKFFPIRDSVTRCELLVNGTNVDDSSFAKQSALGDTIRLAYDYLRTNVSQKISLNVYGNEWGFDTLIYAGDTAITPLPGVNASYTITLRWVGPALPPPGEATMTVVLGAIGTVTVNGTMAKIGNWNTTSSFNISRGAHTSVVNNGYIYVIGGSSPAQNWFNDVQYAPINGDGSLGNWQNTTPLNTPRYSHTSVVNNGYLYIIGGNINDGNGNGIGTTDVQYAKINADGSLGNWQSAAPFNAPGRWGFASAFSNGYLYIIQGFTYSAAAPCTDVQFAKVNADGSLGAWQSTSTFSPARFGHASTVWNGNIYTLGGVNWNGSYYALNDVHYSTINSNGSLGSWQSTAQLKMPLGGFGLVAYDNFLFSTGGAPTPAGAVDSVMYVTINADGSLGTWESTTPFNNARTGHTSVANNGYLYILGGWGVAGNALNDVQYVKIN
jgi:N-acetylneuraminic acid mutarotase